MSTTPVIKTYIDLIHFVGDWVRKLNDKIGTLDFDSPERKNLETCYDLLDACHRALIRNGIDANTKEFKKRTESLTKINAELETTFDEMTKIAETLKNLVKLVEAVEKLVKAGISVA
jgi:hypothetical protein